MIIWNYMSYTYIYNYIIYIYIIYCIPNISALLPFWLSEIIFGSPYPSSFYITNRPGFTNSTAQKVPSLFRFVRARAAPGAGNENSFKFSKGWVGMVGFQYVIKVASSLYWQYPSRDGNIMWNHLKICLEQNVSTFMSTLVHRPTTLDH